MLLWPLMCNFLDAHIFLILLSVYQGVELLGRMKILFNFLIYFIDYAFTVVPFFFSPLFPSTLCSLSHQDPPPPTSLVHVPESYI